MSQQIQVGQLFVTIYTADELQAELQPGQQVSRTLEDGHSYTIWHPEPKSYHLDVTLLNGQSEHAHATTVADLVQQLTAILQQDPAPKAAG